MYEEVMLTTSPFISLFTSIMLVYIIDLIYMYTPAISWSLPGVHVSAMWEFRNMNFWII